MVEHKIKMNPSTSCIGFAARNVYVGRDALELAVADAAIVFNSGMRTCTEVLSHMGLSIGQHCYQAYSNIDNNRLRYAKRSSSEKTKKRRQDMRWKKKGRGLASRQGRHCL